MTKEMTAGREMDALLAEKVMGYTLSDLSLLAYPKYKLFDIESGEFSGYVKEVPHYSTDIAAAWQVVEQVTKTQCDDTGSFYVFKIVKKHHKWCTYIKHPLWSGIHSELGKNYEMHQAYADTAPLAICRCALKVAGGVKINGDS